MILFPGNNHTIKIMVIQCYCDVNIIVVLTDIPSDFVHLMMLLYHTALVNVYYRCYSISESDEVIFVHQ